MVSNLIINTIVPTIFAYGLHHGSEEHKWKAIRWLEGIHAETNAVTKGFRALGITLENAFDSQALIELKTAYCDKKQCLKCAVGCSILKIT